MRAHLHFVLAYTWSILKLCCRRIYLIAIRVIQHGRAKKQMKFSKSQTKQRDEYFNYVRIMLRCYVDQLLTVYYYWGIRIVGVVKW